MPSRRRLLRTGEKPGSFCCALGGPFDVLRATGSQLPGSLYAHDASLLPRRRFGCISRIISCGGSWLSIRKSAEAEFC